MRCVLRMSKTSMPRVFLIFLIAAVAGLTVGGAFFSAEAIREYGFTLELPGISAKAERLPPLNPDQSHEIVFLDTDWPVSWPDQGDYEDLVRRAVDRFRESHPNVLVQVRLVKPWERVERWEEMRGRADLPDVYSGEFELSGVFDGTLLPLDQSFEKMVRNSCDPRIVTLVGARDRVWAWPKWLEVYGLAGNRNLLEASGVDVERVRREGWTWDEFMSCLGNLGGEAGVVPLILDTTRPDIVRYLHMNCGAGPLTQGRETEFFRELVSVFEFLDSLRKRGLFPPDTAGMHKSMLPYFWSGKVAVIGPVGPGFLRHVQELHRQKLKAKPVASGDFDVVMLPIPHKPGCEPVTPVRVHATVVFRDPSAGDLQRTRAAAEFASFWSAEESVRLCNALQVYPAAMGPDNWEISTLRSIGPLIRSVKPLHSLAPAYARVMEESFWGMALKEALPDFWSGEMAPSRLVSAVRSRWDDAVKKEFPFWTRIVPR